MTFRFVSNVDGTDFVGGDPRSRPGGNAFHRFVQNLHDPGNDDQRPDARATGCSAALAAMTRPSPDILSPSRPTQRKWPSSASTPPTCSVSGTGSADATRWTRPSAFRPCSPSGRRTSAPCSTASTRWTSISARAPFERNLPVLMGLLAVWYNDFFGAQTVAVLPYEQYLKRFPAYLQQLTMESNGKHVTLDGTASRLRHRPDLLGRARHQRPAFLLPVDPPGHAADPVRLHRVLRNRSTRWDGITTCCWRMFRPEPRRWRSARRPSRSRAEGTPDWLVPHRVFEGNRPSNTILAERLTPEALGKLVALYEHSVFTQGVIWHIDSFDQWGVELGKVLAQRIIPELESPTAPPLAHDSSTNALIRLIRCHIAAEGGTA